MYSSDGLSVSKRGLNAGYFGDFFADFTDLPSLLEVFRRFAGDLLEDDLLPSFDDLLIKSDS